MDSLNLLSPKKSSNEKTIKIILENLIEKYSLREIIDCIITETTLSQNKIVKENKELYDIINLLCHNTGIPEIFKYVLDLQEDKYINSNTKNENSKKNSLSSTSEEEYINIDNKINDITVNLSDNDYIKLNNSNNSINNDTDIINLTESEDLIENNNNNIISLYENESTSFLEKKGKNSELKMSKKKLNKKIDIPCYRKRFKIYSEEKFFNINKKLENNKVKDLSCHYSIINGDCYKYKLKNINEEGIASFICIDKKCKSYGIYNINNKMFTLLKGHNVDNNYSCNRNSNVNDKIYFAYMKNNNIEEMQVIND